MEAGSAAADMFGYQTCGDGLKEAATAKKADFHQIRALIAGVRRGLSICRGTDDENATGGEQEARPVSGVEF